MNAHRETMHGGSTTPSAIVGYRDETQKRPYAPPRVERLIGMSHDTGNKTLTLPEESTTVGSQVGDPS